MAGGESITSDLRIIDASSHLPDAKRDARAEFERGISAARSSWIWQA
jgi:hypothetical protein